MRRALTESLGLAFDRIDDFVAVQSPLSTHDLGPIMCLWEAAGVGDRERALLGDRIRQLARTDHRGDVALGVLIGLLAAEPG
jgi:hypothetical protein